MGGGLLNGGHDGGRKGERTANIAEKEGGEGRNRDQEKVRVVEITNFRRKTSLPEREKEKKS